MKKNILLLLLFVPLLFYVYLYVENNYFNAETRIYNTCKNNKEIIHKETCYSKEFQKLARKIGSEKSFDVLFKLQKIDPEALGCHFIAHGIGYGNFEKNPSLWREIFRTINQSCTYGAMHGTLEMGFETLGEGLNEKNITTMCGENPRGDCNHIIGHLTLIETENNIPQALDLCNALKEKKQIDFCNTGVFMEHITAFNLISHGFVDKSWLNWKERTADIKTLCLGYQGDVAAQCWKEFAHAIIVSEEGNPRDVFDFCNRAPEQGSRDECRLHSIGILASGLNFNLNKIGEICEAQQKEDWFQGRCYAQLVASTLSTTPSRALEFINFCNNIPELHKEECFKMLGNNLTFSSYFNESEKVSICEKVPSQYKSACLNPLSPRVIENVHEEL